MAAGTIPVKQNVTQTLSLQFKNAAGAPLDITGKTVRLVVAHGVDTTPLIDKSQLAHSNPVAGLTTLVLLAADLNLDARGYQYQIFLDASPADIGTFVVEDTLGE